MSPISPALFVLEVYGFPLKKVCVNACEEANPRRLDLCVLHPAAVKLRHVCVKSLESAQ